MTHYDLPPRLEGAPEEQVRQLWVYLFRLVERMNLETEGATRKHSGGQTG